MAKTTITEARQIAETIAERITSNPGSWNDEYREAVTLHEWSKWMSSWTGDSYVPIQVGSELGVMGILVSIEWYETEREEHFDNLVKAQKEMCDLIDAAKCSLESAKERVKLAQAEIEDGTSALRRLARKLAEPWVYPLPLAPDRQRDLPLGDGEEWRAVPLAEVLKGDVALRSVVEEKLGRINLGQYADLAAKHGQGEKPKKLTRKQWDRVEEIVQQWHASREDGDDEQEDDES